MAKFEGVIKLNKTDIEKDTLTITGEKETLAIILTLIDPELVIVPNIANKAALLKAVKNGVKKITIALGDSEIPKEVLLEALKFCKVV